MSPIRPIGHIAGNLSILAVAIAYRVRLASDGHRFICWVDDDGCVYLALATHPRAAATLRHAPEQRVNTYQKPRGKAFPPTATDVEHDLAAARGNHALRTVRQATEAAA